MGAFLRGEGDPRALVEAVRGAELLLPLLGEGAVWTADSDDIRWLFAFTGTREMHTFLQQKWEAAEPGELPAELARNPHYEPHVPRTPTAPSPEPRPASRLPQGWTR